MADRVQMLIEAVLKQSSINDMKSQIKKLSEQIKPLQIKVELDTESIRRQLASVNRELEAFRRSQQNGNNVILNQHGQIISNIQRQSSAESTASRNRTISREREQAAIINFQNWLTNQNNKISNMTSGSTARFVNRGDLDSARRQISEIQSQFTSLGRITPELQARMNGVAISLRQIGHEASASSRNTFSFGEMLVTAAKKIVIWAASTAIVYGTFKAIQDGVKYIKEMDSALVSLNKVVDMTKAQMSEMTIAAVEMGKEYGHSSVDIMKSMAEFGRVSKNLDDIKKLSAGAILASNVTTMSADDAAKAINTTMIAFKLQAKDTEHIVNSWNEIQNNYRIGAEDLADSIGKVGSAAKQAGMTLEQLEGYTTAITSATGIGGNESGTAYFCAEVA